MKDVLRFGPLFVALWGWAALALAVAQLPIVVVAAVVGLGAALLQGRSFYTTAFVEAGALVAVIWLSPLDKLGFVAVGAALVAAGRAIGMVARRYPG